MGIASTTNKIIIHSSFKYNGLQIPTSWNLQGSIHEQLLVGHSQMQDLIGQHMLHIADYIYLHLGLREPVFTYHFDKIKDLIPDCWYSITWRYLSSLNATAHLQILQLENQRSHDSTIMEHAIQHYKGIELKRINNLRLHLCAFFISNITNSDGRTLATEFIVPTPQIDHLCYPILHWPIQKSPGKKAWNTWSDFLHSYPANSSGYL